MDELAFYKKYFKQSQKKILQLYKGFNLIDQMRSDFSKEVDVDFMLLKNGSCDFHVTKIDRKTLISKLHKIFKKHNIDIQIKPEIPSPLIKKDGLVLGFSSVVDSDDYSKEVGFIVYFGEDI